MRTVLVANRGEIALRVFRTAHAMGMRTVAIYTEMDAGAPHVRGADAAMAVPSYLDIEAIVGAAVASGADVVHPGYGFLSERAHFARALEQAGIRLAGPAASVMALMGRKDAARDVAVAAGVPVVPAYGLDDDFAAFHYPVLVKAAAGGGGKGMRVVHSPADFQEAVGAAGREAATAFGDDTMLVEKYVESGRHIEVQVMADGHGTVLHLWERDCSAQRRHQKVLEEAPAPTIDEGTRSRLTQAAVDLARAVGYVGAGTVEFLLDNSTGDFYFLEMNTRLQVEHPVTEAVTGLDIVTLQLQVAADQPLGITQDEVRRDGWAIEARIYAEDAFGGFLPQAGTATFVSWPREARVDHALESGQVVSVSYDPMLGKVIARGPDREAARRALVHALDETVVMGLTTNTGFVRALAAGEHFRDADIDTAWLDKHAVGAPSTDVARRLAAWVQASTALKTESGPFAADGFRPGGDAAPFRVDLDQTVYVDLQAGSVEGHRVRELARSEDGGVQRIEVMTDRGRVAGYVQLLPHGAEVVLEGQRFAFRRPDPAIDPEAGVADGIVLAPMPGTVLSVRVLPDQHVEKDDVLGIIEAMKMELSLRAPHRGTVASVEAHEGDQVKLGARMFEVRPEREES